MRIIGVDPGLSGAIATLDDGELIEVHKMPTFTVKTKRTYDLPWITSAIHLAFADLVAVEAVTRPGSLRENKAFILGVAYGLAIETMTVSSPVWKRHYKIGASKEESRAVAMGLWPGFGFDKMNKGADGMWEAALIGRYAYETRPNQPHQ